MATLPLPAPPLPLPQTYADVVCWDDLDPLARETASDLETLEQDVYHLLLELPGTNLDDIDRGIGVDEVLSGTLADALKLPAKIDAQISQDPWVTACTSSIQQEADGSFTLKILIQVGPNVIPVNFTWTQGGGLAPLTSR